MNIKISQGPDMIHDYESVELKDVITAELNLEEITELILKKVQSEVDLSGYKLGTIEMCHNTIILQWCKDYLLPPTKIIHIGKVVGSCTVSIKTR